MYTREDVLEFINEVIENENGDIVATEATKVSECGLDSFAITVLYLELDEKYGNIGNVPNEDGTAPKKIIEDLTIGNLIDRVMRLQKCS